MSYPGAVSRMARATIASTTTIAPVTDVVRITGTNAIVNMQVPFPSGAGGGQVTLIPAAIFTMTTAGNIALAVTAVVGKCLIMTYDSNTDKWYPSYTA